MISKTFCPLPWVHQATYTNGSILLCCVAENSSGQNLNHDRLEDAWNSSYWRQVRRQMLKGEEPSACKRCWVEEKSGYHSHRLAELTVWKKRLGEEGLQELAASTQADGSVQARATTLDLRLGNTCNLQCVMCRPHDSSKWKALASSIATNSKSLELIADMGTKSMIQQKQFDWVERPEFWDELRTHLPNLVEMIIGGGEPMLLVPHFKFLEECVRSGHSQHIQLRYHTNLTMLPPELLELWPRFKYVEVFPSIDALGERNTYVRHPSNWGDIEKNLRLLDTMEWEKVRTLILTSVHLLNFYYLDEFQDWIQAQKFKTVTHQYNGWLHPGLVMSPTYLSIQVYPQAVKERIRDRLLAFEKRSHKKSMKIEGVINHMFAADRTSKLPVAREYIHQLDRARGTQFEKTFPELAAGLDFSPSPRTQKQGFQTGL